MIFDEKKGGKNGDYPHSDNPLWGLFFCKHRYDLESGPSLPWLEPAESVEVVEGIPEVKYGGAWNKSVRLLNGKRDG